MQKSLSIIGTFLLGCILGYFIHGEVNYRYAKLTADTLAYCSELQFKDMGCLVDERGIADCSNIKGGR